MNEGSLSGALRARPTVSTARCSSLDLPIDRPSLAESNDARRVSLPTGFVSPTLGGGPTTPTRTSVAPAVLLGTTAVAPFDAAAAAETSSKVLPPTLAQTMPCSLQLSQLGILHRSVITAMISTS